jgi:hypothetical protein
VHVSACGCSEVKRSLREEFGIERHVRVCVRPVRPVRLVDRAQLIGYVQRDRGQPHYRTLTANLEELAADNNPDSSA